MSERLKHLLKPRVFRVWCRPAVVPGDFDVTTEPSKTTCVNCINLWRHHRTGRRGMDRDIEATFQQALALTENETAAALLVLAQVIQQKKVFDTSSAENFGHELAIALRETSLRVNVEGRIETEQL